MILSKLVMCCTFGKDYLQCEALATASSLEGFFTERLNRLLVPLSKEVSQLKPMQIVPPPDQIKALLGDRRKFVKITAIAYVQDTQDQIELL